MYIYIYIYIYKERERERERKRKRVREERKGRKEGANRRRSYTAKKNILEYFYYWNMHNGFWIQNYKIIFQKNLHKLSFNSSIYS